MKIVVCVKQVPDTKAGVKFKPDGTLDRNAMASIMNPDDKAGLEAALRIKDDMGADNVEITVVTMGLPKAEDVLREALAMGADKAVLVTDRRLGGADTWATSQTIAAAIRKLEYDLIITGRQAIDGDTAQVGPQISEHLDLPLISYAEELKIEGGKETNWQSYVVYVTFIATILLWVFDKQTGVNSNVVAMLPVGVFCACGIITRKDLEEINWSVLWMVAGGFAIGLALQETKLADHLINTIPFDTWPALLMMIGSGILCYVLSNFISNTATAALLVPILTVVGSASRDTLAVYGGVSPLLIGIALSASLAMVLPISTPPNALAHATGMIEEADDARRSHHGCYRHGNRLCPPRSYW